jgi:hypothetical protein
MNIRSLGFQDIRVCDIMEVDIREFRVYLNFDQVGTNSIMTHVFWI